MSKTDWPEYHKSTTDVDKNELLSRLNKEVSTIIFNPPLKSEKDLTPRQREVLKLMNPLEYGFSQKETAMILKLSERQVRRIFRQFKKDFPKAYELFIELKKSINKSKRRHKNKPPFLFGECDNLSIGEELEIGHRTFKIIEKF